MNSGGNQIVSCALGSALYKDRSFDFNKSLIAKVISDRFCNLCAEDHIILQNRTAKVEIAVSLSQFLVGLAIVGDIKGRGLAFAQDLDLVGENFDIARGDIGVFA